MCALTNTKYFQEPNSYQHVKVFELFMATINVIYQIITKPQWHSTTNVIFFSLGVYSLAE